MRPSFRAALLAGGAILLSLLSWPLARASSWKRPPAIFDEVLLAPDLPVALPSPSGEALALVRVLRFPPIADLAKPMLPLAGLRIDPKTNGLHNEPSWIEVTIERVADGRMVRVELPPDARGSGFEWSADGRRFAFLNRGSEAMELWVGEAENGSIRKIPGIKINPVLSSELAWMPDQRTLLVKQVPPARGPAAQRPTAPSGPLVKESQGRSASSTYEARDLLTGPDDEPFFEYYTLSQIALVDAVSGVITPVGEPAIFAAVEPSPDGRLLLVERLHGPWSYTHAWYRFPREVQVLDLTGKTVHALASLPLQNQVPIQGVPEGPRWYSWRPTEPETLVWLEALDGGDPARKASHRDRVMIRRAPFDVAARELYRAPHRIQGWWWGEKAGLLLIEEYERERRWRYVRALDADDPNKPARTLFDLSANERYRDPGSPVLRKTPDGRQVLAQDGNDIFLEGDGASDEGDRPFLDRFSLRTLKSERLFRCDRKGYEFFVGWVGTRWNAFLTRRESPSEPPNYFVRTLSGRRAGESSESEPRSDSVPRALTSFTDPTPQIRGITKRIVTYKNAEGTPLSFTLYLPPDYKEGTRLPTVVWAYPLEYSDPGTAGQVTGSDRQFTRIFGPSPLLFCLDGYAVLFNVSMPVIGDPDTAYDRFIEQLVSSAQAAVDKAVELGVTDPDRVGVMGHSHGGLMTVTLLAHSDIFRAGIARSGAYNHTIRPFGFQSERRTLWQARDTYIRLSPVMHAPQIDEPLLIIHGAMDQNPGTIPFQSEKLYEAVSGTGGTVRLVMLPYEQHGYTSREGVEDVLAEQLAWFDRYVKNAGPRKKG
jgi:dipeptidyl aminopeptidase/acylaminoacyl peptidase